MKRFLESTFLPWFLLLVGLLFSFYTAWKSALWIKETEDIRFQAATTHISSLIYKELDAHIQLIHGVAAFMNASEHVSFEEWRYYALENHIHEHFLGFRALGYAPRVLFSERDAHEEQMRQNGFSQYTISQINPTTSDAFPIVYMEPYSMLNQKAFGFDLASEGIRKEALDRAVLQADVTLSSKINLVTDSQEGFLIVYPLFQTRIVPESTQERLKAVRGLIYIAIDAKKMFEQLLQSNYILVDFEIYDGFEMSQKHLLYSSNPQLKKPRLSQHSTLNMYGKTWTIHFKASEVLEMHKSRYLPFAQIIFGVLFFGLLSGWIAVLQRTRKRAYEIADKKTQLLSKSEAEIRSIFQTMQEGIMVLDHNGIILECNLAAQEMLQLSKSDIIGKTSNDPLWKIIHEDGSEYLLEDRPSSKALSSGEPQSNVIMGVHRADGSILWLQVSAQPLFSDDFSKVISVLVTFSDITMYRMSKYKLEKYLEIIDKYVIISSTDLYGRITEVSEAFCKISGYTKEELIGENHNIVRDPDYPSSIYTQMWGSLKNGLTWKGELKNRHRNGTVYWVDTIIAPRYDEMYRLVGYTAIRMDITDKKRVEELSITDRLTGLYNRLKLDELFALYVSTSKRYKSNFSIILLDIDKFKLVNDTYGHQVGDTLLQELAHVLKMNLRSEDAIGRWGGEEFLILLPNSDLFAAQQLAEKLRLLIEAYSFSTIGHKTASFGLATFHDNDDEKSMVARADEALYRAKEKGRNRIEVEIYPSMKPL